MASYIIHMCITIWPIRLIQSYIMCCILTDKYCFRSCANSKKSRVCGSDGKWYESECVLRKQNCGNESNVTVTKVGPAICELSKLNFCDL